MSTLFVYFKHAYMCAWQLTYMQDYLEDMEPDSRNKFTYTLRALCKYSESQRTICANEVPSIV